MNSPASSSLSPVQLSLERYGKLIYTIILRICYLPVRLVFGSVYLTWVAVYSTRKSWRRRRNAQTRYEPPVRRVTCTKELKLSSGHAQAQSLLVQTLPRDIRLLIWEHVLGNVLHLEPGDGTLRWARCWESHASTTLSFDHHCWYDPWTKRGIDVRKKHWEKRMNSSWENDPGCKMQYRLMPLLLTCKLIYSEAIGQLYSCNVFNMRRLDTVLRLPMVMLPNCFQQIRSIDFSTVFADAARISDVTDADRRRAVRFVVLSAYYRYPEPLAMWAATCETLASLQNLQDLRITIAFCQSIPGWTSEFVTTVNSELLLAVLQPLKMAKARRFEVRLTLAVTDGLRGRLGHAPFQLQEQGVAGTRKRLFN